MPERSKTLVTRSTGVFLMLSFVVPAHRLLWGVGSPAGIAFRQEGATFVPLGAAAVALTLALSVLLIPLGRVLERRLHPAGRWLLAEPARMPAAAGLLGLAASLCVSLGVFGGSPFLVDGMSQLFQARLLAGGELGLDSDLPVEFWHFQYLARGGFGWTAQYPPGLSGFLAAWLFLGAPWLAGPLIHGLTAALGVVLVRRLWAEDDAVALASGALLALSPLGLALSGAYMSHGIAALMGLAAWYCAHRAGHSPRAGQWGVGAGLAVGFLVLTRPLTAVVVALFAAVVWGTERREGSVLAFPAGGVLGALPGTLAMLAHNLMHFGGPFTFGYSVAQGPDHGLGFHVDPWGTAYGLQEAVGYTGTELRALGAELLGVPLPMLFLIGVALFVARRVGPPVLTALCWALGPVVAGFFYWHHDLSMGPRLLADAFPAWVILSVWALASILRRLHGSESNAKKQWTVGLVPAIALVAVVGSAVRVVGYSEPARGADLVPAEEPPRESIVFVHDSWESRVSAGLAAVGARDDQIRVLIERWPTCVLQTALTEAALTGPDDVAVLVSESLDADRPPLEVRTMPSGSRIRTTPTEQFTPACEAQARSDFNGIAGLPQRLWRGDLPGAEAGRPLYVRDLGPSRNRAVLQRWPNRSAWVLVPLTPATPPGLLPYEEGMARLWSAEGVSP